MSSLCPPNKPAPFCSNTYMEMPVWPCGGGEVQLIIKSGWESGGPRAWCGPLSVDTGPLTRRRPGMQQLSAGRVAGRGPSAEVWRGQWGPRTNRGCPIVRSVHICICARPCVLVVSAAGGLRPRRPPRAAPDPAAAVCRVPGIRVPGKQSQCRRQTAALFAVRLIALPRALSPGQAAVSNTSSSTDFSTGTTTVSLLFQISVGPDPRRLTPAGHDSI